MTAGRMSTPILVIRSRIGQRKSTATTCICIPSHRSQSPSDTSLQLCRPSFISATFSVYLSRSKNSLMETEYMRSPFIEYLRLRVSFHAPHSVIFHSQPPSFSIRDVVCFIFASYFAPSLLTVSLLQYSMACIRWSTNFLTDRAWFSQESSLLQYDLSPHGNNIIPRQQLPVIFFALISRKNTSNHGKRSNQVIFYMYARIFPKIFKKRLFYRN